MRNINLNTNFIHFNFQVIKFKKEPFILHRILFIYFFLGGTGNGPLSQKLLKL